MLCIAKAGVIIDVKITKMCVLYNLPQSKTEPLSEPLMFVSGPAEILSR